jgi:hypothetical protein
MIPIRILTLTVVIAAGLLSGGSATAALYTYQTAPSNPLAGGDSFTLMFDAPFVLVANSVYDISIGPSADNIGSWSASDTLYGISVYGSFAPIQKVAPPGGLAGGALSSCTDQVIGCFGGAVTTDSAGQIVEWNLVADAPGAGPFATFITYNNHFLGSIDAVASAGIFAENELSVQTGSWNGLTPATQIAPPSGTPELGTWVYLLVGFAGAGVAARARRQPARAPLGVQSRTLMVHHRS